MAPVINTTAFAYIDNIKDGNYIFFLVDLEVDQNIELSITHDNSGNFTLFLFNRRPSSSNVNNDKTLNERIFNNPPTVAYNLDDNPYINYTTPETDIYYIEIILVSGGPDTFYLTSTISYNNGTIVDKDLTRYYLPIIPGFQVKYLFFSLIFTVGILFILYRKNLIK
ncbi:MAG: hypothetical protein ACFE91_13645 [Promethearchaeota archaeon]